ncbi:hypothetical protein GCG54_00015291 [Colletotrichum gloeosporioides]|uniref:Uncharacterized protein n=1 Tax=Colletotrichum gloeosporioides TaxID=474922 RepID=A0A8H4C8H3_COLGL|nr:uncharacterized protein GCG54_00015291 [Colletotrichum gloeosporioides]KAF3799111.1 hypothetical protein GCG54_00015291 [Colletotrichum gloeosporioides]
MATSTVSNKGEDWLKIQQLVFKNNTYLDTLSSKGLLLFLIGIDLHDILDGRKGEYHVLLALAHDKDTTKELFQNAVVNDEFELIASLKDLLRNGNNLDENKSVLQVGSAGTTIHLHLHGLLHPGAGEGVVHVSSNGFVAHDATDIRAVLQQLGSDWNLLEDPVPSDHPAIKDLDSFLDSDRKNAILRFLSALQHLSNITEAEDLPILVALVFTGFEQLDQSRARRMHNEAKRVQARSEQVFVALLETSSVPQPAALAIPGGNSPKDGNDQSTAIRSGKNPSSYPAAYFVDLLLLLENQPANANVIIPLPPFDGSGFNTGSVSQGSILKKLLNRRPDVGDLLVSCRNTNEVVPYIDLMNEVLESALRCLQTNNNKLEKSGMRTPAHNADDVEKDTQDSSDYDAAYYPLGSIESSLSADKAALLSDAANVDCALYGSLIVYKVAPPSVFLYDHSQDSLERYVAASKTNLPEMASVFQPFAKSNGSNRVVIARASASQTLGMSHADFLSLTMESYFDLQPATIETGNPLLQVDEYGKLCGLLPTWHYWVYEDKDADAGDGEFDIL